ncbi:hypothetical protein AJ85_21715 [Alkalihalobacillus alcalophilus ATCC 27647 = CGMCC 1.3604]|uniref:DUF309 domain-containing protein n=1 Tax=Alkalihalobacillus alcalophilus ATCC 27647 = CGMCC 1.3604 TaxID=1218173 RepID=A0A094YYF7_ALKAL|nr:DUF309 domain-containing protein [Alkalihalobacillus alcalophilus]KGA98572.1 hypothetical protein BALCAV_0203535 [Alkalihalobacillus alcalophilus ATCC 27647 = CGMCC 1.3604]MED1560412.1 DUF309 domain-containing protein [Alkalihalobacillus alcalophilus]THG91965.1 hypothetical protein AJ85_21715 [Alkalihalobacillus alcalophilus ATCC 27647 = CGMCC 1.3604]
MYPKAYIDYLTYFHVNHDYFECHEVLEEYWKEKTAKHREIIWVGLIQLSVGLYHERRGNILGADKMLSRAATIFTNNQPALERLSINPELLIKTVEERISQLPNHKNHPFEPIQLPLLDHSLLSKMEKRRGELKLEWQKDGTVPDPFIINKHRLRDRSEVIEERELERLKRQRSSS